MPYPPSTPPGASGSPYPPGPPVPPGQQPYYQTPSYQAHSFTTPGPPPPRRRSTLKVVLIVVGGSILGLAVLIVAVGLLFHYTRKKLPVRERDRAVLVTAEKLAEHFDIKPDRRYETITKHRLIDGSYELDYEYETPDDADQPLYINCAVSVHDSRSDAAATYGGLRIGQKVAFLGEDVREVVRNDLFRWGDKSRMAVLKNDDVIVGNTFFGLKGKRVFYLLVAGLYVDQAENVAAILRPVLKKLDAYDP